MSLTITVTITKTDLRRRKSHRQVCLSAVQRWCVVRRATLITATCHCRHTSRTAIQQHTTVTEVIALWPKSRSSVLLTAAGLDRGRIVNVILSSLITSIVAYRCLDLNRGYIRNNIVLKLDSLRWLSQRSSATPHYWWVRTQGLWPPNLNSAEIFV